MVTGYELRSQLLIEAKNMLMSDYDARMAAEHLKAEKENRSVEVVPLPSPKDIIGLAEQFYEFVQRRD